jgi:hypothetical protein
MNLSKLGWSAWIIFVNLILLAILLVQILYNTTDSFINYPQQVNPTAPIKSDPAVNSANNNYASILLFLQNNPSKSAKFIADIKSKFFEDTCKVRNNIDFTNLAQMPQGMPFS